MSDSTDITGTPTWGLRKLVEIAILTPIGSAFVAIAASPALVVLWLADTQMFAGGLIGAIWVGSFVGSQLARQDSILETSSEPEDASNVLLMSFVLGMVVSGMLSMHVGVVGYVTVQLAALPLPSAVVVAIPIGVSVADMTLAKTTGISAFAGGFAIVYAVLRFVEVLIETDTGEITTIGSPLGSIINV